MSVTLGKRDISIAFYVNCDYTNKCRARWGGSGAL